mmetsp:Transcript_28144/g.70922  ORF Transcript_28144/g.70922 Transcript_28144/m.70922 type:complete len:238 (+) Transcript_28144:44-757(+)
MRSDERMFFYVASGAMTISVVYTLCWHILPLLEERHNYVYGHCTITGAPHWEKYETIGGIQERVIVPVELRIGKYEDALDWNAGNGTNLLKSSDIYHQGIARDQPSGWKYFSQDDKDNYLATYAIGREYECWSRPSTGFHEISFRTHEREMTRLIPQLMFLVIVLGLCLATGVCIGVMDMVRRVIGLPSVTVYDAENPKPITTTYGSSAAMAAPVADPAPSRRFTPSQYENDKRQWV